MADSQPGFLQELKRRKVYRVAIAYIVAAWVALQFLDLVLENVNAPDWVMQMIMAVLAIGFPVALVLAWAFDVTPEGIKADPAKSRAFTILVAVVSVGAIAFVVWSFSDRDEAGAPVSSVGSSDEIRAIDSIAVLPFESFSENQSDEYFADGLADTLLHKLAQLPNLKVIARNSSFQFKGTNKDAREIGTTLEVGTLLEGSVQRQGNQVRVIAQLIDTSDGAHIWSGTFDDTMQNIFELQDRIASDIMTQLQISISEQDRKRVLRDGTDSPEAYDLLLRAQQLRWQPNDRAFDPETDQVLELVDRALEIDPDYAQAWAMRAYVFTSALFFDSDTSRSLEYIEEARKAGQRAIDADPDYGGAYVALATAWWRARNHPEAEKLLLKALELNPNDEDAMQILGLIKNNSDPQMALDLFQRSRELNPESRFVYRQIAFAYQGLGRLDDALAALQEGVERFPDMSILLSDIVRIHLNTYGRPAEAARWASKIVESNTQSRAGAARMSDAWSAVGDIDRVNDWLAQYADRFPDAPDLWERRYSIAMAAGDAATARSAIESVPESPNFRFDRSIRIGGACLVQGDAACMREHADKMQGWLDEFEARGQAYAPRIRYEISIAILRNAAIDDVADRDVERLQELLDLTEDWPITGGRGPRSVDYLRVMLQSLLGDDEAALLELGKTLEMPNDGFVHHDMFRMPPDVNPLITRLDGNSAYAEWLAALNGRREAARGELLRMERDGEILSVDDVAL